jgi:hypothetical protein
MNDGLYDCWVLRHRSLGLPGLEHVGLEENELPSPLDDKPVYETFDHIYEGLVRCSNKNDA